MTDIVERLKSDEQYKRRAIMREAAAEIERLKRELENLVGRLAAREHDSVSMILERDQTAKERDEAIKELNLCRPYRKFFASQANELIAVRAERDRLREALEEIANAETAFHVVGMKCGAELRDIARAALASRSTELVEEVGE